MPACACDHRDMCPQWMDTVENSAEPRLQSYRQEIKPKRTLFTKKGVVSVSHKGNPAATRIRERPRAAGAARPERKYITQGREAPAQHRARPQGSVQVCDTNGRQPKLAN